MFYKIAFALFSLCCIANAQVFYDGSCPKTINLEPDFNATAYLGKWFEWSKYPFAFEPNGKCVTATYGTNDDGTVSVFNSLVDKTTNKVDTITGTAELVGNAKLLVKFPVAPAINVESNYWILSTDYKTYSVVYSCSDTTKEGVKGHNVIVWILTRERFPTPYTITGATNVLQSHQISIKDLEYTIQYDCEAENN